MEKKKVVTSQHTYNRIYDNIKKRKKRKNLLFKLEEIFKVLMFELKLL